MIIYSDTLYNYHPQITIIFETEPSFFIWKFKTQGISGLQFWVRPGAHTHQNRHFLWFSHSPGTQWDWRILSNVSAFSQASKLTVTTLNRAEDPRPNDHVKFTRFRSQHKKILKVWCEKYKSQEGCSKCTLLFFDTVFFALQIDSLPIINWPALEH